MSEKILTRRNITTYGLGAVASTALMANANAAGGVDVTAPVTQLQTDGTTAITAVGTALLALAGIAVVFKWVKASFFS
ncbi:major capsid protein [Acinetobacter higginsii]|uniref:major capsid protein n=1 Tax=Acinetobacter higginsii TaxID=70347 RepID=UPI001F4BB129|nr:major capsid protein [Acinetobacter higginsii]MCH7306488.1 major capsid protein [Acinetobacter higginsii]MCH7378589.1 major capsid protein [Acinetobacter higginsii]